MAITSKHKLILLAALIILVFTAWPLYSKEESVSYLPRNEDMQTISKDYPANPPKRLREVSCNAAEQMFQEYRDCMSCVGDIVSQCPDCCLTHGGRAIRCTSDADSRYSCCAMPFDVVGCPQLNEPPPGEINWDDLCRNAASIESGNHSQRRGCASPEPMPRDHQCALNNGTWLCEEDNLEPRFRGCSCRSQEACLADRGTRCGPPCNMTRYYTTTSVESNNCPHEADARGPFRCFQYTPTDAFASCIQRCQEYADNYDTCTNRKVCCEREVCNELATPGMRNCEPSACRSRINNRSCDRFNSESCALLQRNAQDCLAGGFLAGGCSRCFQEIDRDFNYRFVAKSREVFTIIWQMSLTPYNMANPARPTTRIENSGTYFFSKVAVFKVGANGSETMVHESMLHQKSLEAAFSIFCATQIPPDVLEAGDSYAVRVYYFMPQLNNLEVEMQVNNLRLIAVRTRH